MNDYLEISSHFFYELCIMTVRQSTFVEIK
jgi:hypothetical protein